MDTKRLTILLIFLASAVPDVERAGLVSHQLKITFCFCRAATLLLSLLNNHVQQSFENEGR
jgi:hypothetical protein